MAVALLPLQKNSLNYIKFHIGKRALTSLARPPAILISDFLQPYRLSECCPIPLSVVEERSLQKLTVDLFVLLFLFIIVSPFFMNFLRFSSHFNKGGTTSLLCGA